jgi:hypothetical protein
MRDNRFSEEIGHVATPPTRNLLDGFVVSWLHPHVSNSGQAFRHAVLLAYSFGKPDFTTLSARVK